MSKLLDYWNQRAVLGPTSGSQDRLAKKLEIQEIARYVKNGMRVLDVGCGDGETAIALATAFDIEMVGVDFSESMIAAALKADHHHKVVFLQRSLPDLGTFYPLFDLIYTERTLINLPDWETQRNSITAIRALLKPDGKYVMCENSWDGLQRLNRLRLDLLLPTIEPPWHNRYIRDVEMADMGWYDHHDYSSTYYFVSRILNAKLAHEEGHEPDYMSPLNQIATLLPPIGNVGQGHTWVFRP